MVKKFEFRDHNIKLDIAGEIFEFDVTDTELLNRVVAFGREAQEFGKNINEDDYLGDLENSMKFMQESIDNILGKGASKRIFKDRVVSFFDLLDVLDYIKTAITDGRDEKFNKYTTNRAQRRAK